MWYDAMMVWLMNSPLHGLVSGNMMVIRITGCKSGKEYYVPVGYLRIGGALLTISARQRTWWRNLRGGADVTILLKGKKIPASATVIEDKDGVAEGLQSFIGGNLQTANMLGVKMVGDHQLEPESLRNVVKDSVIVRTLLQ